MPWITANRDGQCSECDADIREGEKAFYEAFKIYCQSCGEDLAPQRTEFKTKVRL